MIRRREASETAHYIAPFRSLCAVMLGLRDLIWRAANGSKFEPVCLTPPKTVVGAVTLTSDLRANVHNELRRFLNS